MLIDYINHLALFQYIGGLLIWFFLLFLLEQYLASSKNLSYFEKKYFLGYFVILSLFAIVRIYTNYLPYTLDTKTYLSVAESISQKNEFYFFGAFLYSSFIYIIQAITFNNHYAILFINNFIFIIALIDLLGMIPNNQKKSLWLWSLFLFLYPSIYWFIPNVLREAVFFLCLVRVLKHSILIKNSRLISYNSILLVIFSILCVALRPQVLPMIYLWVTFMLFKKSIFNLIFVSLFGVVLLSNDFMTSEYLNKVSFEYLEAKKTEGATNVPTIAFQENIIPTSFSELVSLSPYLVFRFLFAPFPWELSNLKYLFAFLDSTIMLLLFITFAWIVLKGYVHSWDFIIFPFMFIVVLGIFEIAFTGAVRHRMPYVLIMSTLLLNLPTSFVRKGNY
ncbi:MAG: hypothetical protein VW904_02230 [bacterium]|jgi:hypothetical protein|tara:strand:+ start:298 stop:1470 length:1173 start_codon:yes stop_codon:yes gene_type:complete